MRSCAKLVAGVGTLPHQLQLQRSLCPCGGGSSTSSAKAILVSTSTRSKSSSSSVSSSSSSLTQKSSMFPIGVSQPTPCIFHTSSSSTSSWANTKCLPLPLQNQKRNYCSQSSSNDNNLMDNNSISECFSTSSSSSSHQDSHNKAQQQQQNSSASTSFSNFTSSSSPIEDRCSISSSPVSKRGVVSSSSNTNPVVMNSAISTASGAAASSSSPSGTSTFAIPPPMAAGNPSAFTSIRTVVTSQKLVELGRDSIMEQPKLMSKEEREEFMSVYHNIVKDLLDIQDMKDMEETNRWMARVLQYNVPHGKRNRGLSTALAYKYLAPEELTEENVRLSYLLGWCVEILQAFFLVSDDIMDESETRRGRPCWYKVDNLGLAAVNDALLLEATIYQILRKYFNDKPCYAKLMEVMHDVTYKTIFGQSLDTRTGQDRRMETYTMDRYSSIVKYKTSYYSFYLPVALAMTLCEMNNPQLLQQVRKVTLEMGHFFQVQDDYLDCFGDVEVTGKIGTDIQDCKCSWLFVIAMQRCNAEQKKFLLENYGKHEPEKIEAVKKLYNELALEDIYHTYEEQTYNLICTHIQQMDEELPKGLFYDMLHKIYKRSS